MAEVILNLVTIIKLTKGGVYKEFDALGENWLITIVFVLVYGFIDIISYIGKSCLLCGAYCYFRFYGGLEAIDSDDDEEELKNHFDEEYDYKSKLTIARNKLLND